MTVRATDYMPAPGQTFNHYRIRMVLQMKGERLLRVIGNPDGDDIATARKTITVTVHQ